MLKISPRFVRGEKGRKKGVVLKMREFEKLIDRLEDASDYEYAKKYLGKNIKGIPLEEVMKEYEKRR